MKEIHTSGFVVGFIVNFLLNKVCKFGLLFILL